MLCSVHHRAGRSKRSNRSIALLRSKRLNPKDWEKGMTFREFLKRRNEQNVLMENKALGFKYVKKQVFTQS